MTDARPSPALDVLWTGDREVAVEKPAGLSSERPDSRNSSASGVSPSGNSPSGASPFGRVDSRRSSDSGSSSTDAAITRARDQFGWPDAQLPHRLDRPTSGILVVSADRARAAEHAAEMREGRWTKWYIARIAAHESLGELVGRHRRFVRREGRLARCVRSGGDPASLEVLAVALALDRASEAHALIRLETGRFHQIRVMFSDLGAPLLGDVDYGGARSRPALELIACGLRIVRERETVRIFSRAVTPLADGDRRGNQHPSVDQVQAMAGQSIAPSLVEQLRACMAAP
ncbi:MAG: pseudouridine synthase [bacterium]